MDVHYKNAGNFIQAKDYNSALTELKKTLENHANNPDVWSTYGVCLFHLKQMDASIKALNTSQELDPQNPYRYSSRAYIHSIMGNTDLAIADYKKCIELDPSDVIALNNLGLVYEKQGHAKKAKTYFHDADQKAGIDHITEKNPPQTGVSPAAIKKEQTPAKPATENNKTKTVGSTILETISSGEGRKAFFSFVKNGFKLK